MNQTCRHQLCGLLFWFTFIMVFAPMASAEIMMPPAADGSKQAIPSVGMKLIDARSNEQDWIVYVAYEGYSPRSSWSEDAEPASVRVTQFMDAYKVLYQHQGPRGKYLLLATTLDLLPVGWVRQDIAVTDEALKTGGLEVHRKGMLITRAENGDEVGEQVPMLDAPRKRGQQLGEPYQLFNVFFVFGQTRPKEYGLPDEEYLLLGNSQYIEVRDLTDNAAVRASAQAVVKGWVPLHRVAAWNTREALEWDRDSTLATVQPRRTVPGQIHGNVAAAKSVIEAGSYRGSSSLFSETLDQQGESKLMNPKNMRYPVLELGAADLNLGDNRFFPTKYRNNELIKIGCIGGLGAFSAEELEDERRKLERLGNSASNAELLFVIDDTGSMAKFFDEVANLIRTIIATQNATSVSVAVAFYNDTDSQPAGWNPVLLDRRCFPLKALHAQSGATIAAVVENHQAVGGGDEPEMVFRGLREAIASAQFTPIARKLVFLIGDYPDKSDIAATLDDERRLANQFFLFNDKEYPIEFYAIQVCPPERDDFTKRFRKQTQDIVTILNDDGKKYCQRTLGQYTSASEADVSRVMVKRYEALNAKQKEAKDKMESVRAGKFNTELGPEYLRILADAGVDLEKLKNTEGAQLFREGYVWRNSPSSEVPQVRMRLMLDRATLEDLVNLISRLSNTRSTLLNEQTRIEDILKSLINAATNEQSDPTLSFEAQYMKRLGLKAHSPLLQMSAGTEVPLRLARTELVEIEHRLDLLRDILEGKQRTWIEESVVEGDQTIPKYVAIGQARRVDRAFTLPGNTAQWYWIDTEEELP